MKPLCSEVDGKMDAKSPRQRLGALYKSIRALSLIPYLARARDYCFRSMTECSGMGNYASIVVAPGVSMAVPISFASNCSSLRDHDDDYREISRAASQRERATTTTTKTKMSDQRPFPRSLSTPTNHSHLSHFSVGRIDEESPCYFSASFKKTTEEDLFTRSRSCSAVQNLNLHGRRNVKAM